MQKLLTVFWVGFVVIGVAVMIGLGFWQLGRLQERRAENAQILSRMNLPSLTITGQAIDPAEFAYRPAQVTGVYDFAQEIVLRNRARENLAGVHVITPMHITGSDKALLVDRGWIPYEYSQPDQRKPYDTPAGQVTVHGLIQLSQTRASIISPMDPVVNADMPRLDAWYWLDITQIQQQFRTYTLLPFYLEQDPLADSRAIPAPEHNLDLGDGPHFSYAIQWFSFAAILAAGAIALARRNMKRGAHAS